MVATLMLMASARGEEGAPQDVTEPISSGHPIQLTELQGAKIHAKLVTDMLSQREGGPQGPVTSEADWSITVEPGARIGWTYQPTAHTRGGTRVGQKIASTSKLDEPWYTPNGEATWQFTDSNLVFIRSYKGGAVRIIIAFKKDGPNLTCTASSVFARERGKNGLVMNSPIDGAPVTIFSWKLVKSSCEVTR
jgi:hypothetical protein